MELADVGRLLKVHDELNRFATNARVTADRAVAWQAVMMAGAPLMTFEEAQRAVIEFYADASEALTAYDLIDSWKRARRLMPQQIAADVRSARARGLVGPEWNEKRPLPPEIAQRLESARAQTRPPSELESHVYTPTNAAPMLHLKRP